MLIYKWTNKINGKIYIGLTTKKLSHRTRMHINSSRAGLNTPLHNAIRKYSPAAFCVEVVEECSTMEQLIAAEQEYIVKFNCLAPLGYNLRNGGENRVWHPESKAKASKSAKARIARDGGRQLRELLKKGQATIRGKPSWNKGKQATDEAKANQSLSHMGQIAWNKGIATPEAIREKQKVAAAKYSKPVQCVETGEIWPSAEECARKIGTSATHIRRLIKSQKTYIVRQLTFKYLQPTADKLL